jgi:hypothetical protein
MIKRIVT